MRKMKKSKISKSQKWEWKSARTRNYHLLRVRNINLWLAAEYLTYCWSWAIFSFFCFLLVFQPKQMKITRMNQKIQNWHQISVGAQLPLNSLSSFSHNLSALFVLSIALIRTHYIALIRTHHCAEASDKEEGIKHRDEFDDSGRSSEDFFSVSPRRSCIDESRGRCDGGCGTRNKQQHQQVCRIMGILFNLLITGEVMKSAVERLIAMHMTFVGTFIRAASIASDICIREKELVSADTIHQYDTSCRSSFDVS